MIGDGPDRPFCFKLAKDLDILDKVIFVPPTEQIPYEFSSAEILAAPSIMESFGLTIAEGMACGLPIWASRVGGIPEVCTDGRSGLLFDPNNTEQARETLAKMMQDSNLRQKMAANAREEVVRKFRMEPIVKQYIEIYECAIAQG